MDKPLVSICIPNYNNAKYLDMCITSALNQTYSNIEIIFVDNNSSDESLCIANKYQDKINIYVNEKNIGQPKNTNKCIELSRGKYLVVLHSDDLLLPKFAAKLVPILEEYSNVGIVVGERLITDENNNHRKITPFYNTNCIIPGIRQAKVFMMTSFLPCQVLVRREIMEKIGGVEERHIVNLDGLLWFKCALVSDVAYIQEEVAIYRIHGEQTTAKYNRTIKHMMEYYITLSEMFKLAKNIPYLEQHFNVAVKRVGELTLRYGQDVIENKNYDLSRRYLALATVFDPEIVNDEKYKIFKECLDSLDPYKAYLKLVREKEPKYRDFSYSPPEGSLLID